MSQNSNLKKIAQKNDITLKILQTHSQTKANKFLLSNRNSANGLLLVPNTWNQYGYTIKDTIEPINRTIPRSPAFIKML